MFAAIHEFPRDYFTNQERVDGAVGLHVLCVSITVFIWQFLIANILVFLSLWFMFYSCALFERQSA